ncbi:EpsG family protein [Aerococcaceae bacterium DSM 111021]|nr:EpsG family protein [Aerococcaceae bacterium DSM 111021]
MVMYIFVNISIIFFGFYITLINEKKYMDIEKKQAITYLCIIFMFLLLFVVSAFRGDFTTDYKNYTYLFNLYNQFDFFETFKIGQAQEFGFVFLSRFIGLFTDNALYLFIVTSFIILSGHFKQFIKDSPYLWLSILLFTTIGSFYTSFNIIRQILAATIIFSGSKYLYERKIMKYILVVIIASLFHKTAFIMIPFYFILNFKFSLKNLIVMFFGASIVMLYLNSILAFFQKYFYTIYDESSYGMTGFSFSNALIPCTLLIFSIIYEKNINFNNIKERIWFNAVTFYAFFNILGLQVQMIERFSEYFAPYALLLIPQIFNKMVRNEKKVLYFIVLLILLILYNFIILKGSGYDPYYFIWEVN